MTDKQPQRNDITERLSGIYTVPVDDGAGPLNGKTTFTQRYPTTPIQREAADYIDQLRMEIQNLGNLADEMSDDDTKDTLREENKRLREALEKYAENDNWNPDNRYSDNARRDGFSNRFNIWRGPNAETDETSHGWEVAQKALGLPLENTKS